MNITLVSINIWDLPPLPLPFHDRKRRRARLLEGLPPLAADIVAVQEAFRPRFKARLARTMPNMHVAGDPESERRSLIYRFDTSGGLLTLSRWPIAASRFQPSEAFRAMRRDERIGRKGSLWSTVDTPAGRLMVVNAHLYAGTGPGDSRIRAEQVRQLLGERELDSDQPAVLLGDFNMALEYERTDRGPTGFDLLADAGFSEIAHGKTGRLATMSPPTNPYAGKIQRFRHRRRLTQVFYRGPTIRSDGKPPQLCLDDPPVSDHYGLRAVLRMDGEAPKQA